MEAVPRLPVISFELKASVENASFAPKLKQYIANFYREDPESYTSEIYNLEQLRAAATRPVVDVTGCQMLKKYYCQLHFLKSRFPMEEGQAAAVYFSWKDHYSSMACSVPDIDFELMSVLYNIGALHSKLGATDSRVNPEGMKMACTHFQCAAWAFQTIRETYPHMVALVLAPELVHYMQLVCLAQAQECILEKSMMDNRKATIIAKVAVQVVDYYKQALNILQTGAEEGTFSDFLGNRTYKDWVKYLLFKVAYHKCIALLYQGQQSEEQQKMGERVAFYNAALDQLEESRKLSSHLAQQQEIGEALAFTGDVVEGKRKAAKNENEFIYHEDVPEKEALQEVKGASLVKGIPFNVNDTEVSGPDIFARLVPMEAHEASSLYSEHKAQLLRHLGGVVEAKDHSLAEFMSSMQLDILSEMHQATGLNQDLVDRAAALSAQPNAVKDLTSVMGKLSNTYHEVEAMLNEIDELLKDEEQKEKEYQDLMGNRPPSIIATDLTREAAKYKEAHGKASESNQNLHKAMLAHVANLKILAQPLAQLQQQIPSVELPCREVDEDVIKDLERLVQKVEDMKRQRCMLWAQLREAIQQDDITARVVTCQNQKPLDQLFQKELEKHENQADLIKQNLAAQDNILKAVIDTYARFTNTRKYLQDVVSKRNSTISALVTSYDTYQDLLAKANKGIEFYNKLETNVSKLLQRIKSACKVQDEEREQILAKNNKKEIKKETIMAPAPVTTGGPKLKDYLNSMKAAGISDAKSATGYGAAAVTQAETMWPPLIRPAPLGSEMTSETCPIGSNAEQARYPGYTSSQYPADYNQANKGVDENLANRMASLMTNAKVDSTNYDQQNYYAKQEYVGVPYDYSLQMGGFANPQYTNLSQGHNETSPYGLAQHGNTYSTLNEYYSQYFPGSITGSTYPTQNTYDQLANSQFNSTSHGSVSSPIVNTGYADKNQTYPINYNDNSQYYSSSMQKPNTPYSSAVTSNVYPVDASSLQYGASTALPSGHYGTSTAVTGGQYGSVASASVSAQYGAATVENSGQYGAPNLSNVMYNPSAATPSMQYNPSMDPSNAQYASTMSNVSYDPSVNAANVMYNLPADSSNIQYGGSMATPNLHYAPSSTPVNVQYNPTASSSNVQYANSMETSNSEYHPSPDLSNVQYGTSSATSNIQYSSSDYPNISIEGYNYPYQQYYGQSGVINASVPTSAFNLENYPQNYHQVGNYYTGSIYTPDSTSNYEVRNETYTQPQNVTSAMGPQTVTTYSQMPSPQINSDVKKEESNIDLLSGLDFSVSQVPLVPQQNTISKEVENIAPKVAEQSSESSIKHPSLISSEKKLSISKMDDKIVIKKLPPNQFTNTDIAKQFSQELEKFEKFVDTLTSKTLSGPTTLELKWKEILEKQELDGQKKSISVARCYPMKNRFPDILPYDYTRVELVNAKDDYVNASMLKNISPYLSPLVVTQTPLTTTVLDFWKMVWEQQAELLVCLLSDNELGEDIYWPSEKDITFENFRISIQSITVKENWVERFINISLPEEKESRVVLHLQFTTWPGSLFPTSPVPFLNFVKQVISYQQEQRVLSHPLVIHCLSGVGRSGLFCLLIVAILEALANPSSLPDFILLAVKLSNGRKNILRDREHLKFAYNAFLCYLRDLCVKQLGKKEGETSPGLQKQISSNVSVHEDIDDPLNSLDPLWATKRGT